MTGFIGRILFIPRRPEKSETGEIAGINLWL